MAGGRWSSSGAPGGCAIAAQHSRELGSLFLGRRGSRVDDRLDDLSPVLGAGRKAGSCRLGLTVDWLPLRAMARGWLSHLSGMTLRDVAAVMARFTSFPPSTMARGVAGSVTSSIAPRTSWYQGVPAGMETESVPGRLAHSCQLVRLSCRPGFRTVRRFRSVTW